MSPGKQKFAIAGRAHLISPSHSVDSERYSLKITNTRKKWYFGCMLLTFVIVCLRVDYQFTGKFQQGLALKLNNFPPAYPCHLIPKIVEAADPFAVNELRRNLVSSDPGCFSRHFDLFVKAFLVRPRNRHMNLHVPKAGGTTICRAVKQAGVLSASRGNCWEGKFCPLWCCCDNEPLPTTCDDLAKLPYDFIMNENWLDGLCPNRVYSIMIREPVSRAISHVNHLLVFIAKNYSRFKRNRNLMNWRLNLGQSNYLTWSLSAKHAVFNSSTNEVLRNFRPKEKDLHFSTQTLRKMDFILNLAFPDDQCTKLILQLMGIGEEIGINNVGGDTYKDSFDSEKYELMNSLDIRLYEYANQLIQLDCVFFKKLFNQKPSLFLRQNRTRQNQ